MRLSVIIPALDEAAQIAAAIDSARAEALEVLVVDAGSADATAATAAAAGAVVLQAPRGRARQMNAGAAHAGGDVLLFLHADTRLPVGFAAAVAAALEDPAAVGGRFDVRLVPSSPLLALTAALINRRSRLTGIATGDQALFVRRATFEAMGGFADLPLMEDVAFTRDLKRRGRVVALRARVATSARRWQRHGVLRTILLMWRLRLLYWWGVAPAELKRRYVDAR
ncbi:MAG: TIGR04283 family arsenosugar biosynthesis glycosyltransferase [Deltaproteobacteria bacterium]|nr:TIGR04283 family arsenosugar biosynthesis glycosyltransferase [Deltaproteobacteria bacterium]